MFLSTTKGRDASKDTPDLAGPLYRRRSSRNRRNSGHRPGARGRYRPRFDRSITKKGGILAWGLGFRKQTPCKVDLPGGAEGIQSVKAAPKKAPNSRCEMFRTMVVGAPKKERDAKIRKCSYPAGCCIPMVLHRCGPRNVNVHYPKARACAREGDDTISFIRPA